MRVVMNVKVRAKRQAGSKRIDRTLRMPGLDAMGQTEIPSKIAGMRHTFAEYTAVCRVQRGAASTIRHRSSSLSFYQRLKTPRQ